jgi:hypothetical protein
MGPLAAGGKKNLVQKKIAWYYFLSNLKICGNNRRISAK